MTSGLRHMTALYSLFGTVSQALKCNPVFQRQDKAIQRVLKVSIDELKNWVIK